MDSILKMIAGPLSRTCQLRPIRLALTAGLGYGHFILGEGAGSGWDPDSETASVLRSLPASGGVIVDVGANNGKWLLAIKNAAPKEAIERVIAIEPTEIPRLHDRIDGFGEIIRAAVGSTISRVTLYHQSDGGGLASVYERADTTAATGGEWTQCEVDQITIDQLLQERSITRVDYLKIDVEGGELDVLRGASSSLDNKVIRAIQFEISPANTNSHVFLADFYHLLSPYGFKISRIAPGKVEHAIDVYGEHLEYFRGATNYVARLPKNE